MTFQTTGCPTTPPQSPSVGTPGQSRDLMRLRTAWQGFAQHNGQKTDLSTPPHSPPHKRQRMSQLPIPMDTQRLLSVLKVIHNELTVLTGRITELEEKVTELKSSINFEFELESEEGEESSGEESDDDSDESDASAQSAPPSFQY